MMRPDWLMTPEMRAEKMRRAALEAATGAFSEPEPTMVPFSGSAFPEEFDTPYQSKPRERHRTVFGLKIPERAMRGIATGLQGYDPRGDFFSNFTRSLAGSMQGAAAYDQGLQEETDRENRFAFDVERENQRQAQWDRNYQLQRDQYQLQRDREDRLSRPEAPDYQGFLPAGMAGPGLPGVPLPEGLPYTPEAAKAYRDRLVRERVEQIFGGQKKEPEPTEFEKKVGAIMQTHGVDRNTAIMGYLSGEYGRKDPARSGPKTRLPKDLTEQDILDAINESSDTRDLTAYMMGRGDADSPDIRRAAQLRLNSFQRQVR